MLKFIKFYHKFIANLLDYCMMFRETLLVAALSTIWIPSYAFAFAPSQCRCLIFHCCCSHSFILVKLYHHFLLNSFLNELTHVAKIDFSKVLPLFFYLHHWYCIYIFFSIKKIVWKFMKSHKSLFHHIITLIKLCQCII